MQLWETSGWEWKFTWTGVGSRDVPDDVSPVLIWVGKCMALLGGVLCTGDAIGSDYLFKVGYDECRGANMPPAQVYYTKKKNQRDLQHDPVKGQHEAERYPTWEQSSAIAFRARGSFEGLFPSGIGLHSRNPMQVLSETLEDPRKIIVFYARPVGKKGKVDGGTNTAVQVAIQYDIKRVNLYVEETRNEFIQYLKERLSKRGIPIPVLELKQEEAHGTHQADPDHREQSGNAQVEDGSSETGDARTDSGDELQGRGRLLDEGILAAA